MMTEERFEELLARGHETPGVEFKGPGSRKCKATLAGVTRAVLGMANRRDGGVVVVGVEDDGSTLTASGLTPKDAATWGHQDLSSALAKYADPYVEIHSEIFEYQGKKFAIISVAEFQEIPVLCKKNYEVKLREGACYTRRRGRIETSEISSQAEMRELLELATEKRLRAFHRQAHGAGLVVHSESNPFDDELESFDSGDLQDKIRSRGYWRIRIRPSVYSAKRIPDISDLLPLIQQKAIRIRGWDFPNVEPDYRETSFLQSHIAQRIDWENLIELWHFYQSGQFSFLGAFYWDWPGRFAYESEDRVLLVEAVVARYVEILELSARLSAVFSDSHSTWIQVGAHGLEGRFLETTAPVHNVFLRARTNPAQISQLVLEEEFSSEQLLAESEEIALRWARELFLRFNWKPESNVLEGIRRLFRGFA